MRGTGVLHVQSTSTFIIITHMLGTSVFVIMCKYMRGTGVSIIAIYVNIVYFIVTIRYTMLA